MRTPKTGRPFRLNITNLAIFFGGASRNTITRAIRLAGLVPNRRGTYSVTQVESAVAMHSPRVYEEHPSSPAALWLQYFEADRKRYMIREALKKLPLYGYGDESDEEWEERERREEDESGPIESELEPAEAAPMVDTVTEVR